MGEHKVIETTATIRGINVPEAPMLKFDGRDSARLRSSRRDVCADICFTVSDGDTTIEVQADMPLTCPQLELLESMGSQAKRKFIAEQKNQRASKCT